MPVTKEAHDLAHDKLKQISEMRKAGMGHDPNLALSPETHHIMEQQLQLDKPSHSAPVPQKPMLSPKFPEASMNHTHNEPQKLEQIDNIVHNIKGAQPRSLLSSEKEMIVTALKEVDIPVSLEVLNQVGLFAKACQLWDSTHWTAFALGYKSNNSAAKWKELGAHIRDVKEATEIMKGQLGTMKLVQDHLSSLDINISTKLDMMSKTVATTRSMVEQLPDIVHEIMGPLTHPPPPSINPSEFTYTPAPTTIQLLNQGSISEGAINKLCKDLAIKFPQVDWDEIHDLRDNVKNNVLENKNKLFNCPTAGAAMQLLESIVCEPSTSS
jgi:hypothetical protein